MNNKKVLIIGGVAAGASCAARLRRLEENTEIIIFERGEHISFANCGLPYYIGDVIQKRESLLLNTALSMKSRFNIDVRIRNEVKRILTGEKCVEVYDEAAGETYREYYDILVLSPGANPADPGIPGSDMANVFRLRTIPDADIIKLYIKKNKPDHGAVIGGGFIGLEMAETLYQWGVKVHLIEATPQLMRSLDPEMAEFIHQHIREKQIDLRLNETVTALQGNGRVKRLILGSGKDIPADLIVLGIGVKPESLLAREAGLAIGAGGGIIVDEYLRTSDPSIYAAGDAVQVKDFITDEDTLLPLAGPANRQGWIIANNIAGRPVAYKGVQSTSIVSIMGMNAASTGKNEKSLKSLGISYRACHVHPYSHARYYPGAEQMCIKILFRPEDGKLLGAQIIGGEGVDKRIDVMATALHAGMTVFDLQELELAYAPPFSSAKDPVNMAGYAAANIIQKNVDVAYWDEVTDAVSGGAFLIDARSRAEAADGMAPGAYNIPVDEIRSRLTEIPADREILVYCHAGVRSYVASRILRQKGYRVKNISGGFRLYKTMNL
ncbi:MAG: CoA-disulfide reductase [Spirochaetes bacterium RBG_16_49_21]|nr:MAG: CoA-disulfide reductase [Spirochaetes bacterium RBG_16_49_21]